MNEYGQSDRPIVSEKHPNNAASAVAEGVEKRGLAKGNLQERNTFRTQSRADVQRALERIRQSAKTKRKERFTALYHHICNPAFLRTAFFALKKDAAPGIDGMTWDAYQEKLEENILDLSDRLRRGSYRAKAVRRVFIPKAGGGERPLGVTALEDKLVQRATAAVLNAIYETDFLPFSYGFRPGRSQHLCSDALCLGVFKRQVNWVLDADIRGFFDAIDHKWMLRFLEHRIGDQRVLRLIQKWLKAGVLEAGKTVAQSEAGTPQGGSISPLLANIYLHYALDLWVQAWRKRSAKGDVIIVRWADDFIVGFQHRWDAERFKRELGERFSRFLLELHPEKTRLFEFGRYAAINRARRGLGKPETFDFLGFTHICGRNLKGQFMVLRKTMRKRLKLRLAGVKLGLRKRLHHPVPTVGKWLGQVVGGYFQYHGIPMNMRALEGFRHRVVRLWSQSIRRRSHMHRCGWDRMTRLANKYLPMPKVVHPYPLQRFGVIPKAGAG